MRSSYSGQGECLMSIEEIKIYLVLFNNFAFWALLRKNTWLFTWWKNALSSCDLSGCLIDSWSPCLAYVSSPWLDHTEISCPEPPPGSDFLSFLNLCSRLLESSGKMGQVDQNWGAEYEHFYFGRLKNYKITHLPPHFTMFKSWWIYFRLLHT